MLKMTSITISLSDDRISKLKKIADNFGITPEDLVRAGIEDLINRPEESFQQTMNYVLLKNHELYNRLS